MVTENVPRSVPSGRKAANLPGGRPLRGRCWLGWPLGLLLGAVVLGLPQGAAAQIENPAALYERALKFFDEGELEASVIALKAVLTADPSMLPAQVLMARIYLAISEPAAAEDALVRARRLGADPDIVWPLQAEALYWKREYKKLLALAPRQGLNAKPQADVLIYRGRALLEMGQFADATAEFQAASELTPAESLPHVSMATAALREGDVDAAQARALDATRIAPADADAWNVLGDVAHVRGKTSEALDAYGAALERLPSHFEARMSRAGILLDRGRLDEAGEDIADLRERAPLAPKPAYLEAVLLGKRGFKDKALEAMRQAAALLDELGAGALQHSPQLVLLAGLAAFELGEMEQAQGHLSRYVDRYPEQPGPRKLLGSILLRNKRSAEAVNVLEPALAVAKNDPKLLELLAKAYVQRGRYDLAVGYLSRAVKLTGGASSLRAQLAMARIGDGLEAEGLKELASIFAEDPAANRRTGLVLVSLLVKQAAFDEAIATARTLVELDPDNATYLNLLGSAQLGAGRVDEARTSFLGSRAVNDEYLPARLNLAMLEARQGHEGEARRILTAVLDQHPDHIRAMVELANLERRTGSNTEALRWLEKAQEGDGGKSLNAALALVDLNLELGDHDAAMRVALDAQGRAPEEMPVLAAVARVHLAQERKDLALEVYKRMSLIAAFDVEKLIYVGRLQSQAGAVGDAIFTFHKAVQANGGNVEVRLMLATLLVREGRIAEAQDQVAKLMETAPDNARVHRIAGDLANAAGESKLAASYFERAWKLSPTSQNVINLFKARVTVGAVPEALELLEGWAAKNPDDLEARRAIGETYLAQGRVRTARDRFASALKVWPQDPGLLNNMAFILDLLGEPEALDYAQRAFTVAPKDPAVLDTLGWLLVKQGQPEKGLGLLRDAHSRASSNAEIRYHVAAALVALDRKDEARRELRIALQSRQPFSGMAHAHALMQQLSN